MKKILVILSTVVAMLIGGAWLLGYLFDYWEIYESHFETYQQLQQSELIDKGWVPSFIPRSAYDIHETHKVDVARVNVRFRFRPGDTKEIEASCTKLKTDDTNTQYYRCKHVDDIVIVRLDTDGRGEILSE
jgi:hypothetical protein